MATNSSDLISMLDTAASFIGAVMTVVIALYLHDHTKRKDKLSIIHEMWKQQQEWNLATAGSPMLQRATEMMVYGGAPSSEEERLSLNSCMFFFLNRVNHIYDAYILKILSKAEFEAEVIPNLTLMAGQKDLLYSLLDHRGYDKKFSRSVKSLIRDMPVTGDVNVFQHPPSP